MRHGTAGRRHRNRGGHGSNPNSGNHSSGQQGNRRPSNNRMQVFDSNGPDVRIRGTAHQVVEKYLALAKDSASAGDLTLSESYLQHAEHYQRIIGSWEDAQDSRQGQGFNTYAPQPERTFETPGQPQQTVREDLALPSSILGGVPKVESKETA